MQLNGLHSSDAVGLMKKWSVLELAQKQQFMIDVRGSLTEENPFDFGRLMKVHKCDTTRFMAFVIECLWRGVSSPTMVSYESMEENMPLELPVIRWALTFPSPMSHALFVQYSASKETILMRHTRYNPSTNLEEGGGGLKQESFWYQYSGEVKGERLLSHLKQLYPMDALRAQPLRHFIHSTFNEIKD